MTLTFDRAIELLEITDISKITTADIPPLEKKAKKRWHPDRVTHLGDPAITTEYNTKFQQIETACEAVYSFLNGTYHAGEAFTSTTHPAFVEPENVIRANAPDIQEKLKMAWSYIKEKKYKWSQKEVVLSDGFKLKDILTEDFKEDIAMLSIVSLFYGILSLGILTAVASAISPVLGTITGIVMLFQVVSCIVGFAPLSRFWLPDAIQEVAFKFINFGLGVYNWAEEQGQSSSKPWITLLVRVPVLFAKLIKYLILFPLYEIAKAITGDKVVGVVKTKVEYYADVADWYIIELINKQPALMTAEELFHLSHIYSELSDVKSKTYEHTNMSEV